MATISNFVTHIVSSNVNLMHNNRFKQAKDMTFYDPSSNKPSTVPWEQMFSGNTCKRLDVIETNKTLLLVGSIALLDQTLESKNPRSKVPERDVLRRKVFHLRGNYL